MKKAKFLLIAMLVSLTWVSQGFSFAFVSLTANPFADPSYDFNTSLSGYVDYTAVVSGADPSGDLFTGLQLFFGGTSSPPYSPIFNNALTSFAGIVSAPAGASWGLSSFVNGRMTLTGTGLSVGQSLVFRVNYTLWNPAGSGPLGWSSSDPWSQNFSAISAAGDYSPGSAHLAPEPGSMILLGSGLLGMGLVKRYRQRRNARA